MSGFTLAQAVEAKSVRILTPLLRKQSFNGQFVLVNKGRLGKEIQATAGDVIMNKAGGTFQTVEIKAEAEDIHGNLFLESWSNRSRWKPGWFLTIQSDWLLYHFVSDWKLYAVPFDDLRSWAFNRWRICDFNEKPQGKYEQLNDTWGWCVPIATLRAEIPSFTGVDLRSVISDGDLQEAS